MAVTISKTKYIIFQTKGKKINMGGLEVVYNLNDLGQQSHDNIIPLDRIHNHHEQPHLKSYKLLGINLDENLTFDQNTKK